MCMNISKKGCTYVKFIYSEKATKFCEIFTLLLSYVVPAKSEVKILQNFVAFSEYMNFNPIPTRVSRQIMPTTLLLAPQIFGTYDVSV